MAKPKLTKFQQNHGGRSRVEQHQLEVKRARNHSPAIERKRAENAWHTNPLAPIPPKALRHQAMTLMRTLYKPGFTQLSNEEKRVNSISEKRKADNAYYLNWLTKQSELLNAHEENARAQVLAAGQQTQQEVQKGWEAVSPELQQSAAEEPGAAGQLEQTGEPSLLQASAQRGANMIGEQRAQTQDQLETSANRANTGPQVNFAEIAALEGKRLSDQNEGLTSIRNSRQELRENRAAEAAKRYAEGLDKEIEKAQARASIAASEATAAIEAKRFGLDAKKAKLEAQEFGFEKGYKNRKLGLEGKEFNFAKEKQRVETELEEKKINQTQAKIRIEKLEEKNRKAKVENEGQRTPAEKAKAREKQRTKNQQINANIETTVQTLHQTPRLRKLAQTNPAKLKEILHNKYGYNPVAIQVAVELYLGHELSQSTRRALESIGYNGKYV
jgi:hypothetical protein